MFFSETKPLIGMLHLDGSSLAERVAIAMEEADILVEAGFDAAIVENYFGDAKDVEPVVDALLARKTRLKIGINILGGDAMSFDLSSRYPVSFIQIDSVCGHLGVPEDMRFADRLAQMREASGAALLGGVRFKYQPVKSGRTEAEDVRIGAMRCDAIVVTSQGTGMPTDLEKVARFRAVVGAGFPLLIGAGMTKDTAAAQLEAADGAIVGSWLKEGHVDHGRMRLDHARALVQAARQIAMTA